MVRQILLLSSKNELIKSFLDSFYYLEMIINSILEEKIEPKVLPSNMPIITNMGIERPCQFQSMKVFDFNNYDNKEELVFTSFVITDDDNKNYQRLINCREVKESYHDYVFLQDLTDNRISNSTLSFFKVFSDKFSDVVFQNTKIIFMNADKLFTSCSIEPWFEEINKPSFQIAQRQKYYLDYLENQKRFVNERFETQQQEFIKYLEQFINLKYESEDVSVDDILGNLIFLKMGSVYKKMNLAKKVETIYMSCVPEYPDNFRYKYKIYSGLESIADNKINDVVNNKIATPLEKTWLNILVNQFTSYKPEEMNLVDLDKMVKQDFKKTEIALENQQILESAIENAIEEFNEMKANLNFNHLLDNALNLYTLTMRKKIPTITSQIASNQFSTEDSIKLMESFDGTDAELIRNLLQKPVGGNDRSYSDILHLLIAKHIKLLQAEKILAEKN